MSIRWLGRAILLLLAYLLIQTLMVIAHEHVHSVTAWLLGYTPTPFTVVWGNPLTIRGWDEGVPYDALFPRPGHPAEAAIGAIPLLMHAVLVASGLVALLARRPPERASTALFWYLLVIANLGELISYIVMRPFIPTGDTGRFNEGLLLSPWYLFVSGTLLLLVCLWLLSRRVTPRLLQYLDGRRLTHLALVVSMAFVLFLWTSGLRMLALYPDPQWRTGLVGVAAFLCWVLLDPPRRDVRPSPCPSQADRAMPAD